MDRKQMIREALQKIAHDKTTKRPDLWSAIVSKTQQKGFMPPMPGFRVLSAKFVYLIVFAFLTIAAVLVYRLMIDPGLQKAQDAGLVSEINQTAAPFIYLGEAQKPSYLIEGEQNLSATLDWAYADINRVAFQFTLKGLNIPGDVDLKDVICIPRIIQNSGEELLPYSPDTYPITVNESDPDHPIVITYLYVFRHPLDHASHPSLDFDISFRFGACNPVRWNDFEGPTPVPVPAIGVFHAEFQIPVQAGTRLFPNQTVSQNHLSMRLDEITLSPSFITSRVCFDPRQVGISQPAIILAEAEIKLHGKTIASSALSPVETEMESEREYCQRLWFASGYDGEAAGVTLVLHQLTFIADETKIVSGPWTFEYDVRP